MKIIFKYSINEENTFIQDVKEDLLIYDLKVMINSSFTFRIDAIELYTQNHIKMNDNCSFKFYKINENDIVNIEIEKNYINVLIEAFQNDLEKIMLYLSMCTSVYMIKKMIENKTKINIKEQILYMDNRILPDSESISDFIQITLNKDTKLKSLDASGELTDISSPRSLKLKLLIKQSGSKFKLDLDFSFNYMKSLKKINWDEEAPDCREITDGLCLMCYCLNKKCKFYNQMYIHNLGHGKIDVILEISRISCFICSGNNIDVRNIGFVNCEWLYKGILKKNLASRVSGEGKTMDNKLHTFKEVDIKNLYEKLLIDVKEIEIKSTINDDHTNKLTTQINHESFISNTKLKETINNSELEIKN